MPTRRIVSAHDVASALKQRRPDAGKTQIMKWLYIAQGLHLAWHGGPMFGEDIQAWEKGPVVADYWHDINEHRTAPQPQMLDDLMSTTLDAVLAYWGAMTGQELIKMTHSDGGPWCDATESVDEFSPRNPPITHDAMRAWFSQHPVTRYRAERQQDGPSRWSLIPEPTAPGLGDALNRVLSGEVIRASRPA